MAAEQRSRRRRLAVRLGLLAVLVVALTAAQNFNWCSGRTSRPPQARIAACTRLIDTGSMLGLELAGAFADRGRAFFADAQYARAIADFDVAVRRDPNHGTVFNARGNAAMAVGNFDQALADYASAARLLPDAEFALKNRGFAHFLLGNFPAAAPDLAQALQRRPNDAYTALWLFLSRARAGAPTAAAELEANTRTLKPAEWPRAVVDLFLERGTPDAARLAGPDSDKRCEAQFYLGEWRLMRGEPSAAITAFRSARDACPRFFIESAGARAELKRLE